MWATEGIRPGVVALSHPELIVAYNELPYHWWCAQPPCGAFKLNTNGFPLQDVYVVKAVKRADAGPPQA